MMTNPNPITPAEAVRSDKPFDDPDFSSPLSMETPSLPAFAWSQENNRSNRTVQ